MLVFDRCVFASKFSKKYSQNGKYCQCVTAARDKISSNSVRYVLYIVHHLFYLRRLGLTPNSVRMGRKRGGGVLGTQTLG